MNLRSPLNKEEHTISQSNIILNNQSKLIMTGVQEVYSTNDKILILKSNNKKLTITGTNLNITKLLVDTGELEANGTIDCIKYSASNQGNLLKRLFK